MVHNFLDTIPQNICSFIWFPESFVSASNNSTYGEYNYGNIDLNVFNYLKLVFGGIDVLFDLKAKVTVHEAIAYCQSINGYLPVINSTIEANALAQKCK